MGAVKWGAASRPLPGLRENGDTYLVDERDGTWFAAVIDGLGHGHDAAEASGRAREVLSAEWPAGPEYALQRCHAAVRGTRGAVVGAVWADLPQQKLIYVGVGNIEGLIASALGNRHLTSLGGFLGGTPSRFHPFEMDFGVGDILIMHSDGISNRFDLSVYPGLLAQEPELIAQVLMRDWARASDDATVVVARYERLPE